MFGPDAVDRNSATSYRLISTAETSTRMLAGAIAREGWLGRYRRTRVTGWSLCAGTYHDPRRTVRVSGIFVRILW